MLLFSYELNIMKILFVFFNIFILINIVYSELSNSEIENEWNLFKIKYKKNYPDEKTEKTRFDIFKSNLHKVREHNDNFSKGLVSFEMDINLFSDLLPKEIRKRSGGGPEKSVPPLQGTRYTQFKKPKDAVIPDEVDWVKAGIVSPIRHQGECGSCWAFSAVSAIESHYYRATGKSVALSEQHLVDCSSKYGNEGCKQGSAQKAFLYIVDNGIAEASKYLYEDKFGKCRYNQSMKAVSIKGYGWVKQEDEQQLKEAVATVGPVVISIDAHHDTFSGYRRGVYYEPKCKEKPTSTHLMVIVGYGTDPTTKQDYWLVKNSWGVDWGIKGYIKMARNKSNHCLIASYPFYPIIY